MVTYKCLNFIFVILGILAFSDGVENDLELRIYNKVARKLTVLKLEKKYYNEYGPDLLVTCHQYEYDRVVTNANKLRSFECTYGNKRNENRNKCATSVYTKSKVLSAQVYIGKKYLTDALFCKLKSIKDTRQKTTGFATESPIENTDTLALSSKWILPLTLGVSAVLIIATILIGGLCVYYRTRRLTTKTSPIMQQNKQREERVYYKNYPDHTYDYIDIGFGKVDASQDEMLIKNLKY